MSRARMPSAWDWYRKGLWAGGGPTFTSTFSDTYYDLCEKRERERERERERKLV